MLACAAALYRMPLLLVQGGTPATRIRELSVRHKYRRPPSHQAAVKQLDLFGLPGAKHPTPEFEWQQLPGDPPDGHRADGAPTRQAPTPRSRAQLDRKAR